MLVTCKECGKEFSDSKDACIHCGYALEKNAESKQNFEPKKNEKKSKNKLFVFGVLVLVLAIIIIPIIILSNINKVDVPYVYDVKEETAVAILTQNNLVPIVQYEYNEDVENGYVIYTSPNGTVDKNSTVYVYVSKGPSYVKAIDSVINWNYINPLNEDSWIFNAPYISEGYLYIKCTVTFGTSFEWKSGGFGTASINDTFDKTVPLDIITDDEKVTAGKETTFTLKVSTSDLDVQKPTSLYTSLLMLINGNTNYISANFSISW